jgi:hypothetical protein
MQTRARALWDDQRCGNEAAKPIKQSESVLNEMFEEFAGFQQDSAGQQLLKRTSSIKFKD